MISRSLPLTSIVLDIVDKDEKVIIHKNPSEMESWVIPGGLDLTDSVTA